MGTRKLGFSRRGRSSEARYSPPERPQHHVTPRVRDFDTIDDLIAHARDTLGATHVSYPEPGTMQGVSIYFPRKDGQYERANTWQKAGYWHAAGPGNREIIRHLPRGAQSITRTPRASEARHARESGKRLKVDRRAYDFFRKQAGGAVGYSAETAWRLAAAEQEATARGWTVEWDHDPEGWDSLGDIDPDTVNEVLYAVLRDEDGNVLGSLGSIVDPDRNYSRVVEAELALEALNEEGWSP